MLAFVLHVAVGLAWFAAFYARVVGGLPGPEGAVGAGELAALDVAGLLWLLTAVVIVLLGLARKPAGVDASSFVWPLLWVVVAMVVAVVVSY